jgi:hypothetical protein
LCKPARALEARSVVRIAIFYPPSPLDGLADVIVDRAAMYRSRWIE